MPSPSSIFPVRNPVDVGASPSTVTLDAAGDIIEALRSPTARDLLTEIYDDHATTSQLAAAVDTSLQNALYHLNRLQDAGLVEVVGTWYSEKGAEMDVYGPAVDPLVIWVGATARHPGFRQAIGTPDASTCEPP